MLINVEVDNQALPESSRGERTEMKDADLKRAGAEQGVLAKHCIPIGC